MAELLKDIAARKGTDPALIDERGGTTWAALDARVNRLVSALRTRGLRPGDTIALMAANRREWFEVLLAALHGGWIVVPVNWHWVANELANVLEDSGAALLVIDERYTDVARTARADTRAAGCRLGSIIGGDEAGYERYEDVLASGDPAEPAGQAAGGPMFYTSGTTGFPKGVRSTLIPLGGPTAPIGMIGRLLCERFGLPQDGVSLLCGPAYHSAQWAYSLFPLLGAASTIVMRQRFDEEETLALIDRHRVTNLHLVPTQMIRLLRLPEDVRRRFSGASLREVHHGAAPCSREIKRQMLEWWGPVVTDYYGGTEGGFLTLIRGPEWREKPGSIGRPLETVEVAVLDDDGQAVPAGTSGQIWFRSRMGADFRYHRDEAKTAAAHRKDGFGTLGDIGYFDADGYLFLSDRKIDMIISGGVNIYPAEIESALVAHPSVADAAVFGIPNGEMGEEVKAAVELMPGATPSDALAQELIAHCRTLLAGYKAPRSIDFEEHLPRHPTGKLYKRLLRDPYWKTSGRAI
jgi:long-chain acyl-CoA synthetase